MAIAKKKTAKKKTSLKLKSTDDVEIQFSDLQEIMRDASQTRVVEILKKNTGRGNWLKKIGDWMTKDKNDYLLNLDLSITHLETLKKNEGDLSLFWEKQGEINMLEQALESLIHLGLMTRELPESEFNDFFTTKGSEYNAQMQLSPEINLKIAEYGKKLNISTLKLHEKISLLSMKFLMMRLALGKADLSKFLASIKHDKEFYDDLKVFVDEINNAIATSDKLGVKGAIAKELLEVKLSDLIDLLNRLKWFYAELL